MNERTCSFQLRKTFVRKNDEIWSVQVGQGALRKLVPIDLHPTKFLPIV